MQNIGIQMENHSDVMKIKCLCINEGPRKSKLITVDEAGIQKKKWFPLLRIPTIICTPAYDTISYIIHHEYILLCVPFCNYRKTKTWAEKRKKMPHTNCFCMQIVDKHFAVITHPMHCRTMFAIHWTLYANVLFATDPNQY